MKLLQIITTMDPKSGGPSQGLRNINSYIKNLDVNVDIVCLDNNNYIPNEYLNIINLGPGISSYCYHPKLINWLINYLPNYDFVTVHGIWQFHNYAVYKAIKILKNKGVKYPKVIIMPHGMLDPYFQKAENRKMKAFRNEIVWRLTEKKVINAADALFFTCEDELNLAKKTFKGYNPQKTINVGYGIQNPPIYNESLKYAFEKKIPKLVGKKYWLFLSRIDPKKGIKELIEVYNRIYKTYSTPELVIAGPLNSNFTKSMQLLAINNPKIHFTGMLEGEEKWGAIYGAELFILPSYQENFGIALVEALACKIPVLITKQINIWKEINDGNCGWIIKDPTSSELEEKLIELSIIDKIGIEKKKNNAFQTFKGKFEVSKCAIKFVESLKSL